MQKSYRRKPRFARKKKFYKKGTKKPTFRQIRSYGVRSDPFPTRLHARCKYIFSGSLASDGTVARVTGSERAFRLNSIWDPDFTALGHTVVGHANFAALYKYYLVRGAKVEISWSNPSGDGVVAFASLNQTRDLSAKSDLLNYSSSLVYSSDINNTGAQKSKMHFYVRPWNLLGLSKMEWLANKSNHSAGISTSPSTNVVLRVACSGSAAGQTIHCSIKIIYYTEFYERAQLDYTVHT